MSADLRFQFIRHAVAELVALESEVAGKLERAQQLSAGHPAALATLQRLQPMVQAHRDQLVTYLKDAAGAKPGEEPASPRSATGESAALSDVMRDLSMAFQHCALSCAMLYEVALRLYEPRLRAIAPEHLRAHAEAAQSIARLLPEVVARQLAQDGLHCACICPMCSIGACGCVALGTETLTSILHDRLPATYGPPGFVLQTPKPDSQLARAGVQGGDILLAVNGQQVRTTTEIQAELRKHTRGDEVRFVIQRGSTSPREFVVRHAGDYPKV